MSQEDFEDLNVMNLAETKFERAPTSESSRHPLSTKPATMNWLGAVMIGGLATCILVAVVYWACPQRRATD